MIKLLNHWVLHRTRPAFDDKESLTVIELVGQNTAKINEIVEYVNKNIDDLNKMIEDFMKNQNQDMEIFKIAINQKIKDFTDVVDLKLSKFEGDVLNTINYIKDNLASHVTTELSNTIKELVDNGTLVLNLVYNEETEELNLVVEGGE